MKNERHAVAQHIQLLVSAMVSEPDKLRVRQATECNGTLHLYVLPHQNDFGVVCGARGRTINALKLLADRMGIKTGVRCELHLEETFAGDIQPDEQFEQDPQVDEPRLIEIVRALVCLLLGERPVEPERLNDQLKIRVAVADREQAAVLAAIADVCYPIGFRHGIILKVGPQRVKEVA